MASSSGNSSGSTQIHHSGSDDGMMDQRKRKRMESNRESARRSRMRKQKHMDDLMNQANNLKNNNAQILTTIDVTTQRFVQIEAENSVLRAQVSELSQRLDSLNEILNYINTSTNCTTTQCTNGLFEFDFVDNPWNMMYLNQPTIMPSTADMVGY
ncbi:bZIP transcription factor 11 [Lactuca sativa]|uniref:BZIP domain-containing protein n=1 Tax=Lactuca sativa TaxID=4236 RepID=A0A9R1XUX2_LACSA|nr:bZIP transcription factor 11 [Lactuca sativa]KAJ0226539.1 hypothetical protein LSAT_V11C100007390 [Lactuca sativa]